MKSKTSPQKPLRLPDNTIVVEVRGGVVQNVFTPNEASVLVIDWDNINEGSRDLTWVKSDSTDTMINDQTPLLDKDTRVLIERKIRDLA